MTKFTIETSAEMNSLKWLAARYTYANELHKACINAASANWDTDGPYPVTFDLPENVAWNVRLFELASNR